MTMSQSSVYLWTAEVTAALRRSLESHDFVEILPAILSERFEPGARHSVAVLGDRALPEIESHTEGARARVTVSGSRYYYLPVSHCVEKQLALEHLERVYCVAPCVRLLMEGEDQTERHLYSFFQVEIEWRTESAAQVYSTIESVLTAFSRDLRSRISRASMLTEEFLSRIEALAHTPYERLTFAEARQRVGNVGGESNPHASADLTHAEERVLSMQSNRPFWLTDYPEGVRDSLYRRGAGGTFLTYDLVLPGGLGELATGGLRPDTAEDIAEQATCLGKQVHSYYKDWKARTRIQTGGIGIGLERLIRYCSGADTILDLVSAHDHGPNGSIRNKPTQESRKVSSWS